MGVELAIYRARIGTFVSLPLRDILSDTEYLLKEIASVRQYLTHDKLDRKGAVVFIALLLLLHGIEPNPGPKERDQQSLTKDQQEDSNDINITLDSNTNPIGADSLSQFMESLILDTIPKQTGSSTLSDGAEAIAIPGTSSGAVTIPTTAIQLNINYTDKRKYKDEIKVDTMEVKNAENMCTGKQTVIHTDTSVDSTKAKEKTHERNPYEDIHPDLVPLIKTTTYRIKTENEKQFLETKASHDAHDKLRKNRYVVIKGNTGDGKTTIAIQLLNWLNEEHACSKPLQLDEIKDLKLIAPNLNLFVFIDDIFSKKERRDVKEWNAWLQHIETLFIGKQNQTNFLLITIRNEVFNALPKHSLGEIFTDDNIIDLTLSEYNIKEERQNLLAMYTPTDFTWGEKEMERIIGCAPHIGFPQCCQLFCKSAELQKKRAAFFEEPVQFVRDALSKLPECSAILFLFLNDGEIKIDDLDPNGDKVDIVLLEQAFMIKLGSWEIRTKMEYEEKIDFVRESLDKLSGYLVRKEEHWSGKEVYIFDHFSIYATVALLYGNKTPVGYIQHCPRKSLRYLTRSKTSKDRVIISSDHYNHLCERLFLELEKKERDCGVTFGFLDVWKDHAFVVKFCEILTEKNVSKHYILNKACRTGLVECALYLLSMEAKPDKETDWWGLITRSVFNGKGEILVLKEVGVYLDDLTKQDLVNKACRSGSVECALYLLTKGVKPDKETDWWRLITRGVYCGKGDVLVLKEVGVYLDDFTKQYLVNEACRSGSVDCALHILKKGFKPDKYADWWKLITRGVCYGKGDKNVLKEVGIYLNDLIKQDLLDKSCRSGSVECALYLLSEEEVKPDKYADWWGLITRGVWCGKEDLNVLKEVCIYLNDEIKHDLLNKACFHGSVKCASYFLNKGGKPDEATLLDAVWGGSMVLYNKVRQYGVTPTGKDYGGDNALHRACQRGIKEMVTVLCNTYPHLIHDTNKCEETPLYMAAKEENCSVFQTVERAILLSLCRVEDGQHKCEISSGRMVHRNCVCSQYMCQLVNERGKTILHQSCWWGRKEMCVYLCETYPVLTTMLDNNGRHFLHYLAYRTTDVDLFIKCERCVRKHMVSLEQIFDIKTILDMQEKSVLDLAKEKTELINQEYGRETYSNPLYDHLNEVFHK